MVEMTSKDDERAAREQETIALLVKAFDPNDPYDGHHGDDRSEK